MPRLWAAAIPVLCSSAALCGSASAQTIPADYKGYLAAVEAQAGSRHADVPRLLEPVWNSVPPSPLTGRAALLAGRSNLALNNAAEARRVLQQHRAALPQPAGGLALAQAAEAAGAKADAAAEAQSVYYRYPLSKEAAEAQAILSRLQAELGDGYPPPLPRWILDRAEVLRKAGRQAQARQELLAALANFDAKERELAQVRAAYGSYAELAGLNVSDPEAGAERLYLMHAAARKDSRTEAAASALDELEKQHPSSRWTQEALLSWANHFLLRNEASSYVPLYTRCAGNFPANANSATCHWKVAWSAWMRRLPEAKKLLTEHVARFPSSDKAAAALYFLGRHNEIHERAPLSWYAFLAAEKAAPPARTRQVTARTDFTPTPLLQARTGRARQLATAGLYEWAEVEMQAAASERPFLAAMELAEFAAARGAWHQSLRYIKSVARGYLSIPLDEAPLRFWKFAFPLPFEEEVRSAARQNELDAYLVAALIRQESEFNPGAVSRAKAYGLTQVLPSTGRQIARRVGYSSFTPSMLFRPEVNLRIGTHYLKQLLNLHGGRWEHTLAAYNAGKSRVDNWVTWYDYREPAEFVETIPFSETREYVQVVLRNAHVYRAVYSRNSVQSSQ